MALDLTKLGIPGFGAAPQPAPAAPAAPAPAFQPTAAPAFQVPGLPGFQMPAAPAPVYQQPAAQPVMVDAMSAGLATAKPGTGGVYLTPGNYVLKIKSMKKFLTRSNVQAFAADCEVAQTDNPAHPIGCERQCYQDMAKQPEAAVASIASLLYACLGLDGTNPEVVAQVGPSLTQVFAAACDPAQNVLAGRYVLCTVQQPKQGKTYCKHIFRPMPAAQ